jgi:hypothetical protein
VNSASGQVLDLKKKTHGSSHCVLRSAIGILVDFDDKCFEKKHFRLFWFCLHRVPFSLFEIMEWSFVVNVGFFI